MICGRCGVETIEPKRHEKGVSPPDNEAHVDHIIAKSNIYGKHLGRSN